MCGIAGLIGFKGDLKENIGKMNHRMLHRGPDDEGIYISENGKVALGHRRLSIVDLSKKGAQPMMSHSGRKVIAYNGEISRLDAALLFVGFIIFMVVTVKGAKTQPQTVPDAGEQVALPAMKSWLACCYIVLGLACLVVGSNLFVDGATSIARTFGVSDAVIGLTIVAGGTSLPELATSIVAAKKGKSAIAIGNVIGSNVFNILMILGVTGLILPMDIQGITIIDYSVMLGGILLLWFFSYTKYTVARWEGAVLTAIFAAYLSFLIYNL